MQSAVRGLADQDCGIENFRLAHNATHVETAIGSKRHPGIEDVPVTRCRAGTERHPGNYHLTPFLPAIQADGGNHCQGLPPNQTETIFFGLVGLTATKGSVSRPLEVLPKESMH